MRKALIGLILAATVMTPVAVQAQNRGRDGETWQERRSEARQERQQARQERQQSRQERPQARQERPQPQVQRQAPTMRGNWQGGNRGDGQRNWRGGNRGDAERNVNRGDRRWQGGDNDGVRFNRQPRGNDNRDGRTWRGNTDGQRNWQGDRDGRRDWQGDRDGRRDWQGDRDGRRDWRGDRDGRRDWRGDRDGRRDWRDGRRRNWSGNWNRSWRNDRRYDWNGWRYRNRNIFRLPRYYSPYRDWSYRRFGIGFFLEPLFFDQRYWLNDPFYYRLPPAPPGTQWIRYYNDVILVDTYSGEVIDVIYDFFW